MLEEPSLKWQRKCGTSVVTHCLAHSSELNRHLTIQSLDENQLNKKKKTQRINAKSEQLRARFDSFIDFPFPYFADSAICVETEEFPGFKA